jgi:hypothetical protein
MSGNTIGATLWSDGKKNAPMLPRVSRIQRCPTCGKYFFCSLDVTAGTSNRYGSQSGELPLEYLKEAFAQIQSIGHYEYSFRMAILWAFNDRYGNMEQSDIPIEEWEYHMNNVQDLLQMGIDNLFRAELYREIGDFDKAIQILETLEVTNDKTDLHNQMIQQAYRQAQQHNRKIFVLYGNGKRKALTLDNYKEEPYTPSKDDDTCNLPF